MPNGPDAALRKASRIGPAPSRGEEIQQRNAYARQEMEAAEAPSVFDSPWTRARRALTNIGESVVDPANWDRAAALPLEAITLVTRKPLTELLKRLHPRTASGQMVDPQEFPRLTGAVQEVVERFPRTASHVNSISMLPPSSGHLGVMDVPHRITKQLQTHGPEAFRAWDQPVASIQLNEVLEQPHYTPLQTVSHEFGHVAQFLADPRGFARRYADAGTQFGYVDNPYEVGARFTGANQVRKAYGGPPVTDADIAVAGWTPMTSIEEARQALAALRRQ